MKTHTKEELYNLFNLGQITDDQGTYLRHRPETFTEGVVNGKATLCRIIVED